MMEQRFQTLLDLKFQLRRRCHTARGADREILEGVIRELENLLGQDDNRKRFLLARALRPGDLVG